MPRTTIRGEVAHLVAREQAPTYHVLGPTEQYLTPADDDRAACLMHGVIPPGVDIPLHSHADPETFVHLSGEFEGLTYLGDDVAWIPIGPGDIYHVPGGARHAFRNRSGTPAEMLIVSAAKIGRFFQEVGTPIEPGSPPPGPPSPEALQHFLETSRRYGSWNASPEENDRVGISLLAA